MMFRWCVIVVVLIGFKVDLTATRAQTVKLDVHIKGAASTSVAHPNLLCAGEGRGDQLDMLVICFPQCV